MLLNGSRKGFILSLIICVCVSLCGVHCVQMPGEARSAGSSGAGASGGCQPRSVGARYHWGLLQERCLL